LNRRKLLWCFLP